MSAQQPPHHLASSMMAAPPPASSSAHQSPVHAQEPFSARPPPTPTFYTQQQAPTTTPQQSTFAYATGSASAQHSPISAGGSVARMSPAVSQGQLSSLPGAPSPSTYQRPFGTYLPPAPVYSNVNNPNGQLALVGGMQSGMMHGFNSGHAANMPHMFGHHHPQPSNNDRPFKCDQCPQSFNRNHDLKRHKRIHLAVKPFPCNHCDKSFSRKDALKVRCLQFACCVANGCSDTSWSRAVGSQPPAMI